MTSLIGILISLLLLMFMAYRGHSVIVLAPVLAMLAVVLSGESGMLLGTYTQIFMVGLGTYTIKYFPVFLLGAVFGKMMNDSGGARSIAHFLVHKLGHQHAMLAIVLSCGILTYGGVSLFVVSFAVYPIAAALFRELAMPKRLIPGAIALGAVTFTMTALPGTPAIQNAIPMPFFKTTAFAAPGLGTIAGIVMLVGGMFWLRYRLRYAMRQQEGYGQHSDALENHKGAHVTPFALAILPIIVVIMGNLILSKYLLPSIDSHYLSEAKFGSITLSDVIGLWAIIASLVLACVVLGLSNWSRWTSLKETVNQGAMGSLLPIFNTASEVGYGSVIASLAGFALLKAFLLDLSPSNPLISEAVSINVLAGITGSASGGLSIALNTMGEAYLQLANQFGISPEIMHRVASLASGGLDTLPHNGAVISMLAICGLTHKESYKDIFVVAVVIPIVALAIVISLGTVFGSF